MDIGGERMEQNTMHESKFNHLYKSLWPKVYNFIYYKVQNAEEAEELTQDVFQKVFKQVQLNKVNDSKLKSYTFTAARNIVYDKWRRKGKNPKLITLEGLSESGYEIIDENQVIGESLLVQEALDLLSAEDRKVIILRIIEGYSIKEVAQMLDKPEGTIKVLQYRALQKLRDRLLKGGYFDE